MNANKHLLLPFVLLILALTCVQSASQTFLSSQVSAKEREQASNQGIQISAAQTESTTTLEVAQIIPAPNTANVEVDSTITLIFNRPIVPLGAIAQMDDLPQPLTFEPAIEGMGEWLNTAIYVFTPAVAMADGTTYTVKVVAGLTDLDGHVLSADFQSQFTTVPPKVLDSQPYDGERLVGIDTPINIFFNQPIDPASAEAAFRLRKDNLFLDKTIAGNFQIKPVDLTSADGDHSGIRANLTFTPTEVLDFDSTYIVTLDAGVQSLGGGKGMREKAEFRFRTIPLPQIIRTDPSHGQSDVWPYTDFRIVFNTPIDPNTVMPNLTFKPPLSPTQVYTYFRPYDNSFVINFEAKPSTAYEVDIRPGIADPYGNLIRTGRTISFRTDSLPPHYHLLTPDFISTYDASQAAQLLLSHLNVKQVTFSLYQTSLEALFDQDWRYNDHHPPQTTLVRRWTKNLENPQDKLSHTLINLTKDVGGTLAPGIYYLDSTSPQTTREYYGGRDHLLVVSELNLTLKSGPKEILIWATDLATGEPVAELPLSLYKHSTGELGPFLTDEDGVIRAELDNRYHNQLIVYNSWRPNDHVLPFVAASNNWGHGLSVGEFGLNQGEYGQPLRLHLDTDRPLYRPGQTVYFKGTIRADDDATFRLPDLNQVQVTIRTPNWTEVIYDENLKVSDLGTFDGEISLADDAILGPYVIQLYFHNQKLETSFQVAAYRPPEFEVTVQPDQTEMQRGDAVRASIQASYFFGGPLAEAAVEWTVFDESYYFEPPWGGRYRFDQVDDPYSCRRCWWYTPDEPRERLLSGLGETDAQGQLALEFSPEDLATAMANLDHPLSGAYQLILEANVTGPDHQFIAGRETIVVHPGPYYIGLSPQKYVSQAKEETIIDLVAVDWTGERLSDIDLKVSLYRHEWQNTFIENDENGFGGYWESKVEDIFIEEVIVTTDDLGEAVAALVPPQGGSYKVIATPANPTTDTEAIASSIFIWVAGEDHIPWRRENHDRITLVSDKTSYELGEVAEILIPSPFDGPHYALLTVERGRIIQHELLKLESNSFVYQLPITEQHLPNIYISAVLIKGREGLATATSAPLAEFKMGLLPLDVSLASKTLSLTIEADTTFEKAQAEPGDEVTYTITASQADGSPAAGAELLFDVVDKAVLSLQPRLGDILSGFYARRALEIQTASGLNLSMNRFLPEVIEDLDMPELQALRVVAVDEEASPAFDSPAGASADTGTPLPEGIDIRAEFADTAFWMPRLVTDDKGQAQVTFALPDNLTTWVVRGVGATAETLLGTQTEDLVATKPLLIRPVAPRFFVVDDQAQLAANINNNTNEAMQTTVSLSAEGLIFAEDTPSQQSVILPPRSETNVTWRVTVTDVTEVPLIFSVVSADKQYTDASKPRLATGSEGSLRVYRYTASDIVGTAGQLVEGGTRSEAIYLPPNVDQRRGALTVQLDPSLAAGMRDGLRYLKHFDYECTEQTVSRFLPNLLTYRALQSLGIDNPELKAALPDLIDTGLNKLYEQQNPDGGWGWWHNTSTSRSNLYVSAYVVYGLIKARQADIAVDETVLTKGIDYLQGELNETALYYAAHRTTRLNNYRVWLLYVLTEAGQTTDQSSLGRLSEMFDDREILSAYAKAYLAQALWLHDPTDPRIDTLLSDLNNAAILSATGAHWEEEYHDRGAMNTDTRSTAIILDTLAKLDPDNALIPNVVRWLMMARQAGIWETTQETAWALISLTTWMVETGELQADYDFSLSLNQAELSSGQATAETVQKTTKVVIPVADLVADAANRLTFARSDGTGRLYYSAHLEVYPPVDQLKAIDRGIIVSRRYTLADCTDGAEPRIRACPEVREVKLGDVIRVDLTIIAPNDLHYLLLEDPLPAGGEAIDTGLATTSLNAMDASLRRQDWLYWGWWHWYSRSELRDEKVVLVADYLSKGTYEYSYTFRATLPGDYQVIPTVVKEWYFPEVFGRSEGRLLTISNQ